ncbi:putative replication protein O [Microcystis phage Mwe-JY25]
MTWLRWWTGTVNDPKWRLIAAKAGARPGECVAVWACLLEAAKQTGGDVSRVDLDELAVVLGFEQALVEAIVAAMRQRKLIVEGRIAAWERRQPKREDGSAERGREWRQQRKAAARQIEGERPPPFPDEGSISFSQPFADIARANGRGMDVDLIATAFRAWCMSKDIPLNGANIVKTFETFCKRHRVAEAA